MEKKNPGAEVPSAPIHEDVPKGDAVGWGPTESLATSFLLRNLFGTDARTIERNFGASQLRQRFLELLSFSDILHYGGLPVGIFDFGDYGSGNVVMEADAGLRVWVGVCGAVKEKSLTVVQRWERVDLDEFTGVSR